MSQSPGVKKEKSFRFAIIETEYLNEKEFDAIYADATELLKCYAVPSSRRRKASHNS